MKPAKKPASPGLAMKITIAARATPRNPQLEKQAVDTMHEAIEKVRQVWALAVKASKAAKP